MKITIEMLKEKSACSTGRKDFLTHYPDGCEYQELLNACAENGKDDYAQWLMLAFGPTDSVLNIDGDLEREHSLFWAGRIACTGAIRIKGALRAGCGIKAGWGINAGEGIEAGCGIKAGKSIEAGCGIEAGCDIKAGGGIKAGWCVEAGCGIKAGGGINAGCDINAGCGIKAGGGIEAGEGIKAGEGIEAGEDWGIYAGLRCRVSDSARRMIRSKTRPKNIMCGEWEEVN